MNNTIANGGSQLTIPGLQRAQSRACVACGGAAEAFCARCGVTPYCSPGCQRLDWAGRHRAVCHNLARLSGVLDVKAPLDTSADVSSIPAPPPLRRPRSPPRDDASDKSTGKRFPQTQPKPSTRVPRGGSVVGRYPRDTERQGRETRPYQERQGQGEERQGRETRPYQERQGQERGEERQGRETRPYQERQGQKRGEERQKNDGYARRDDSAAKNRRHYKPYQDRSWEFVKPSRQVDADEEENWDAPQRDVKPSTTVEEQKPKIVPKSTFTNQNNFKDRQGNQKPLPTNENEAKVPTANQNEAKGPTANHTPTNQKEAARPATNQPPPASVVDTTPTKKLIPKNCMIELLSLGDTVVLSVECDASESRSKLPGFVCVSMHEKFTDEYTALCDDYGAACEAEKEKNRLFIKPTPGDTYSYLDASDGGWYRARWLSSDGSALLDAGRVAPPPATLAKLPAAYGAQPEFSCHLAAAAVQVGDSLSCVLKSKTASGFRVSVQRADDGAALGEGELTRWLPEIRYPPPPAPVSATTPQPKQAAAPTTPATPATPVTPATPATSTKKGAVPEVSRPPVTNNSKVFLVHVTDVGECYVRPADDASQRAFDNALHDTATYGLSASPVQSPPTSGDVVVSQFEDGLHYRALVRRTNVKLNKYQLEYIDFGNTQINTLDKLYPCPPEMTPERLPVVTSRVALLMTSSPPQKLNDAANLYLDALKDDNVELILTLPDGAKTAPSGAAVTLTVEKSRQSVNAKVDELCTPEWMLLQKRGGSVLEVECLMYPSLQSVPIPPDTRSLVVLDYGALDCGVLSACPPGPHIRYVLTDLTEQINKYCESELGREPYLPKHEELCIARLPPYPQWFRAVVSGQPAGAGGAQLEICYIDYGNVAYVGVESLRKMMPEFMRAHPALASLLQIRDFPKDPTVEMLERAVEYLQINEDGQGTLRVESIVKDDVSYIVDAPDFIKAVLGK